MTIQTRYSQDEIKGILENIRSMRKDGKSLTAALHETKIKPSVYYFWKAREEKSVPKETSKVKNLETENRKLKAALVDVFLNNYNAQT